MLLPCFVWPGDCSTCSRAVVKLKLSSYERTAVSVRDVSVGHDSLFCGVAALANTGADAQ